MPHRRSPRPRGSARAALAATLLLAALPPARATASPVGPWTRISYNELTRYDPCSAYDPIGRRMIYFGTSYDAQAGYETQIGSIWALSLGPNPTWARLQAAGTPPPLGSPYSMAYDPDAHRVLLYGPAPPVSSGEYGDIYALSLDGIPTWSLLVTGGDHPGARTGQCTIYDAANHRLILHGGIGWLTSTFALQFGTGTPTWSLMTPAGPAIGHKDAAAVYDPVGQRMIVDGGFTAVGSVGQDESSETWALSLDASPTWTSLTPATGLPPEHREHGAVFDPVRNALVIFGGYTLSSPDPYLNQAWQLSLGADPEWTQLATTGPQPPGRNFPMTVADLPADRLVAFGGGNSFDFQTPLDVLDDSWSLPLGAGGEWSPVATDGNVPNVAPYATGVQNPTDSSLVVYGGLPLTTKPLTDLRALPLTGPDAWRELHPTGTPPPLTSHHSAIVDPIGKRMIVFGGLRVSDGQATNETWALSVGPNPAWTQLTPSGTPPDPRHSHSAIYDAAHRRMIVFGGETPGVGVRDDAWQLSLDGAPAWSPIGPPNGTTPRASHTAVYDAAHGRMVVFGGRDASGALLNSSRALSLGPNPTWSSLPDTGPNARRDASAIYDPVAQQMVVFGGFDGSATDLNDVWQLRFVNSPPHWTTVSLADPKPVYRFGHVAIFDATGDRMIVQGGAYNYAPGGFADAWSLPLGSCPPAMITAQPAPQACALGSTVVLTIGVTNALSIHWRRNGTNLVNGGRVSGALTATLTLTNFQASDVGNYSVQATDTCGDQITSNDAPLSVAAGCTAGQAVPPAGMAAWWAMEPGPGNTIPDVLHPVGDKNHASLTGNASLVSGLVGTAVRCNGVNDGLHVPATLSPALAANSSGLSIDAWILPRSGSSPAAYRMILEKGLLKRDRVTLGSTTALAPGYAFYLRGGGTLGFQIPDPDYNPVTFEPAMTPLTMDEWHHVAVTVTPIANGGHFYVDGAARGTFTPPSGILGNLADLYVGEFTPQLGPATPDSAFNGDIDEVEIFTTAVDSASIRRIWAAGCAGKRRVQLLAPSTVELRGTSGEGDVCASLYNLSSASRTYHWAVQPVAGGACPSTVPVAFTPDSGSVTVAAEARAVITSTAWAAGAAMSGPFSACYRVAVTDASDGGVITAQGAITYTGAKVTGKPTCTPPDLGAVTAPAPYALSDASAPPYIVGAAGDAHFTVFNDSTDDVALDYTITATDAATGGPSALIELDDQPTGAPVTGAVTVPARGSADVPVHVSVTGDEPLAADELVLSADRDGDGLAEPMATMHVAVEADTSLAFVGVDPQPGGGAAAALALRAAPNPFAESTTIALTLARGPAGVALDVFDVAGRHVRRLAAGVFAAGETRFSWDGRDDAGATRPSRLYFVRARVGGAARSLRVIRITGDGGR